MIFLRTIPLLILPAIVYALIALPAGPSVDAAFASRLFSITMISGGVWTMTAGHLVTILAVFCLFIEIVKSTSPTRLNMVENALAVVLFVLMLIAFLLFAPFATSEFFLLLLMVALDFMAGAVVMTMTSRRTVEYSHN